ncbi:MAG: radical SAM protein [Candidatus Omnitrophica bacterium]|nr:radical SAM protein [Candidatus Omnitrophota bacterium]MCM8793897.1 radical SAM protein [Candidatus Omnitrophota bacterium]
MIYDTETKLKILGSQARFDSSGMPKRFARKCPDEFIYQAVGEGGFCVNLFKVLQTNKCINNCLYCANRKDRDFLRISFSPQELAGLFIRYHKKRKVQGLFLSSAIEKDANLTQEKMLETIRILRKNYYYQGYIHFKILPGVDRKLIIEAAKLCDRISLNLEAPGEIYLKRISIEKDMQKILIPTLENIMEVNRIYPLKAGITTQLIVGASQETDKEIVSFADEIYKRYRIKRIYYSGFIPVRYTPLENRPECSNLREYRLYQVDFLLRKYGFKKEEIIFDEKGNLYLDIDPKLAWAKRNPEFFPVEINKAGLEELLHVPGIGRISAEKIINFRKFRKIISLESLKKLVPSFKRTQNFITLNGKFFPTPETASSLSERQLFFWEEF